MCHPFQKLYLIHAETDRAVDPVPIETQPPPPKIKQAKKTKVGTKAEQIEDISNLPSISHQSHGSTPGQVDHMITTIGQSVKLIYAYIPHSGDDTRSGGYRTAGTRRGCGREEEAISCGRSLGGEEDSAGGVWRDAHSSTY